MPVDVQAIELKSNENVSRNKTWTIKLNKSVDKNSVNHSNIYMLNSQGNKEDIVIDLLNDNKWITVSPRISYKANETYKLYVSDKVKDINGNELERQSVMTFTTSNKTNNKIVLAWNYVYNKEKNKLYYDSEEDFIMNDSNYVGINVISPTWFDLKWENGKVVGIVEKVDKKYLDTAKENGYEIWPCIQQMNESYIFSSLSDYADKLDGFFKDDKAVNLVIDQLVYYMDKYDLKGLNIDFEGMGKKNRDNYTDFVRKLSQKLHTRGIVTSVDVNEPIKYSAYSECYDRVELAKYVDYVMFMAYDEHYLGDKNPGSVGSYVWVEEGINKFLDLGISKDKLVLGVPSYMREFAIVEGSPQYDSVIVTKTFYNNVETKIYSEPNLKSSILDTVRYGDLFKFKSFSGNWYKIEYKGVYAYIQKQTAEFIKGNVYGEFAVGWKTRKMSDIDEILSDENKNAHIYYDDEAKQDVLVYYDYDKSHTVRLKRKIWLENEKSMKWRMDLAEKYDLRGIASWSLNLINYELLHVMRNYNNN